MNNWFKINTLNYGSIDFADETDYGDILDVLLKEI